MILVINEKESAVLALHLAIMRKSYKKLIKRDYKARRDVLMQSYDYLLEMVKEAVESENEVNEVHLDELDREVLCAVLSSYVDKLGELELDEEMMDQLQTMKELELRCKELKQYEHETA